MQIKISLIDESGASSIQGSGSYSCVYPRVLLEIRKIRKFCLSIFYTLPLAS